MILRTAPPKAQRIGVLMSVVVLHVLALLAALIVSGRAPPLLPAKTGVNATAAVTVETQAQRPPPPPKLPSKLVDKIKKLSAQAITFEPDSTALAGLPGQCSTLDAVSQAIIADPRAVAAVVGAPPETRSIAEAIVIWNAGWSSATMSPDSPLSPARTVIEQSLALVEDGCLDEPITGPRLVPIAVADGKRTMFLVFGSGNWTWRQLVAKPEADEALATGVPGARPWYEIDWL